jgi:hypothetical protein
MARSRPLLITLVLTLIDEQNSSCAEWVSILRFFAADLGDYLGVNNSVSQLRGLLPDIRKFLAVMKRSLRLMPRKKRNC